MRENTAELRVQLEEARKTLALRKTYDELAEKITNNRLLRPREDQHANLEKLNAEIAELEKESSDYARTWAERREQFGRIVDEGMQLRRLIRDEKEEVERREGMEEREEGEEGEVGSQRGRSSGLGTPRPEAGGATPLHAVQDSGRSTPHGLNKHRTSRSQSRMRGSRQPSPAIEEGNRHGGEGGDVDMAEDGEMNVDPEGTLTVSKAFVPTSSRELGAPRGMAAAPPEGLVDDEKEEGEEDEGAVLEDGGGETMDTT